MLNLFSISSRWTLIISLGNALQTFLAGFSIKSFNTKFEVVTLPCRTRHCALMVTSIYFFSSLLYLGISPLRNTCGNLLFCLLLFEDPPPPPVVHHGFTFADSQCMTSVASKYWLESIVGRVPQIWLSGHITLWLSLTFLENSASFSRLALM